MHQILGFLAILTFVSLGCGEDDDPVVPPLSGSCCAANGSCSLTTQTDCPGSWTANTACDPNPCSGTAFELRIRLVDVSNHPMAGVQIHAWNRIPCWTVREAGIDCLGGLASARGPDPAMSGRELPSPSRASGLLSPVPSPFNRGATIPLLLDAAVHARLQVLDQEGQPVRNLITGPLAAGVHHVAWDGRDDAGSIPAGGSRLYVVRLETWNPESTQPVHRDSVSIAHYEPPGLPLGVTDALGVFRTQNRAAFPSLASQGSLMAIDEEGIERGLFAFDDTLVIAAVDTLTGLECRYQHVLGPAGAQFDLVWQPARTWPAWSSHLTREAKRSTP